MKEEMRSLGRPMAVWLTCFAAFTALVVSDWTVFATQFFRANSTWYTKIPAGHTLRAGSTSYINYLIGVSNTLTISQKEWSVPIWYANASTPTYDFVLTDSSVLAKNATEGNGWNKNVPIPNGARPAGYGLSGYYDRHMVVIRTDIGKVWDFQNPNVDANPKSTYRVKVYDLNGDGIDQPYTWAGSRVAPVPLLHGLITYDEIQNGYIDHAIAFATYSAKTGSPGVYPCVTSNNGDSSDPWAPWLGFRFQLDPSLNLDTLSLSPAARIVAKALQEYGMIFVENNGPGYNSVYAESREYQSVKWGTTLTPSSLANIPMNRFRLVEPVYPSTTTQPTSPSNLRFAN